LYVDEKVCQHCGSRDLIEDDETGEIICAGCGLVVSEVKLIGRDFIKQESQEKHKTSRPSTLGKMNRLMDLDMRLRAEAEDKYVLRLAIRNINRLVNVMHLPDVVRKDAESIYRRAQKDRLVLRGTIDGFSAAAIYAACRVHGLPRTLREVSEVSSENVKELARMYRILLLELKLSVELDNPLKHLSRIASAVGLSHRSERLAADILVEAMKLGHHIGKNPKGLAASTLYIACKKFGERCSQESLSEIADISSLTIRKRVKGIRDNVDVEKIIEDRIKFVE
jgi:transcription initiation factor TFIIB